MRVLNGCHWDMDAADLQPGDLLRGDRFSDSYFLVTKVERDGGDVLLAIDGRSQGRAGSPAASVSRSLLAEEGRTDMSNLKGPMAVESVQKGRTSVNGGYSAEFLEEHILPAMKGLGCEIIRTFDAVAQAEEKFPPGARIMWTNTHPALRGWLGTVAGEYRPATSGGADVLIDWDNGPVNPALRWTTAGQLERIEDGKR